MANLRNYTLIHKTALGAFRHILSDSYKISWVLTLNKPSALTVELPSIRCSTVTHGYAINEFDEDDRLELWRKIGAGPRQLVGEAPFLVSKIEARRSDDSKKILYIEAVGPVDLLNRRINPNDADDGDSDLDDDDRPNDDTMKFIVRNNFGPGAGSYVADPDPFRRNLAIPTVYFQTQADLGQADMQPANENYTGQIENSNILQAVQKIAEYSVATNDVSLFFDVVEVSNTPPVFEFRTYYGQRGVDRTVATGGANALTLVEDLDIADYTVTFDYTDTLNRVYAGARGGTGAGRIYDTSTDPNLAARLLVNPFALRESFESSTSDDPADILKDATVARLEKSFIFQASGLLTESNTRTYGIDYNFGDRVSMVLEGLSFDAHIDTENGELADGGERLTIGFNTEPIRRRSTGGVGQIVKELGFHERDIRTLKRIERA